MTEILPIDSVSLEKAKNIIERGGVVAFPTETVYGLGANAFDNDAVNSIFRIKGRPNDNPLIVHVHKDYDLSGLVCDIPDYAKILANAYLPGPLTMVYKSLGRVSAAVSCGLGTLAVRIPSDKNAQKFLKYVNLPIAAPSANISKHVSPTSAEHVYADLNGKVELILDGGKCTGGIESTVLDCTGKIPVILRSGLITKEMIIAAVGECGEYALREGEVARSPGMKYKHYAPTCPTALFDEDKVEEAIGLYDEKIKEGVETVIICDSQTATLLGGRKFIDLGKTSSDMAKNLYSSLRQAEKIAQFIIAISPKGDDGVLCGVKNRLTKACKS